MYILRGDYDMYRGPEYIFNDVLYIPVVAEGDSHLLDLASHCLRVPPPRLPRHSVRHGNASEQRVQTSELIKRELSSSFSLGTSFNI